MAYTPRAAGGGECAIFLQAKPRLSNRFLACLENPCYKGSDAGGTLPSLMWVRGHGSCVFLLGKDCRV